jgi:nicotinate-nucleotide pyrophosphorylase (carboxylating)
MREIPVGSGTRIADTRKTTPGLRALERYAVRAGGAHNHRDDVGSAILIKDNHIVAAGGVAAAFRAVRERFPDLPVEVEVDDLDQLDELLAIGADAVLLDNLGPERLAEAVRRVDGRMLTEASGGITPERAYDVAASGVDLLSIGWLTHSPRSLDVGLDL